MLTMIIDHLTNARWRDDYQGSREQDTLCEYM
jgi:hypothetical protein